jgi:glycerol 2-dehydrogenase (NADP+)
MIKDLQKGLIGPVEYNRSFDQSGEMATTHFKLNTGAGIPALGLGRSKPGNISISLRYDSNIVIGTWQSDEGQVRRAVAHAIVSGYRHIDAAYVYGNEEEVGQGIKDGLAAAGISREELFITTKLWCTYHTRVQEALDLSLGALGLDYVDLYLMHWPVAMNADGNHDKFPLRADGTRDLVLDRSHVDTYKDMETLLQGGKVKAIGVCNYSRRYLEQLLPHVSVIPAVNQIENHPLLPQQEIVDFCRDHRILITAYSPLGSTGGPLMSDSRVIELATKKRTSPSSILLSYHIERGSAVLAKSVTPSRIEENMKIVSLTQSDLSTLDEISRDGKQRFVYPAFGRDFGFPDKTESG